MSTEELKMVMDMLSSMGGAASNGFYVWIAYKVFVVFAKIAMFCVFLYAAFRSFMLIKESQDDTVGLKTIRSLLLPSSYGGVCQNDMNRMVDKIVKMQAVEWEDVKNGN